MFKLYASTYGVRAVLWMQGETDAKAIKHVATGEFPGTWDDRLLFNRARDPIPAPFGNGNFEKRWVRNDEEYRQKLRAVIEASRGLLNNRPVPWVIARTSHITEYTSPVVIAGQDVSRLGLSAVYQGPSTDDLGTAFRRARNSGADEPVHFNQNGLEVVANRWTDVLKSVCRNTTPVTFQDLGTESQGIEISDDGKTASAPAGFSGYSWTYDYGSADADFSVSNGRSILTDGGIANGVQTNNGQTVPSGTYRAFLKNSQGNDVITQTVDLPYIVVDDTEGEVPPGSGGCVTFGEVCSGNDQEVRNVTINVATAGNYPLTIAYKSQERAVNGLVRVNNNPVSIFYPQTGSYATATTASVYLNAGPNTIGLSSGSGGGFVCFNSVCVGTGGGTPPPNCDFSVSANTANAGCGQQVQLTANCNGANCDGVSYSWNINNINQNGQSVTFNAPGSNGTFTYTVTASRSGCSAKTATGTVNVSGCGGGTGGGSLTPGCYVIKLQKTGQSLQAMGDGSIKQQGGNGQTNQIWKAEDAGNSQYRFTTQNGSGQVIKANDGNNFGEQLSLGNYTADDRQRWAVQQDGGSGNYRISRSNGITWDLNNFGNNPELQLWGSTSEPFYDYRSFRFESAGCSGGTPPPPPPGGGSCAASINTINYNWDGGNNSISFTVNSSAGNPQIKLSGPTNTDWMNTFDFGNSVWYQAVTGAGTGDYTVSVRPQGDGGAGCSFSFSVPSAGRRLYPAGGRLAANGASEAEYVNELVVMPNPSKGPVTVRFRLGAGEAATLSITNLLGKTLHRKAVVGTGDEQTERIELEHEAAGIYLIRLSTGKASYIGKIVLER